MKPDEMTPDGIVCYQLELFPSTESVYASCIGNRIDYDWIRCKWLDYIEMIGGAVSIKMVVNDMIVKMRCHDTGFAFFSESNLFRMPTCVRVEYIAYQEDMEIIKKMLPDVIQDSGLKMANVHKSLFEGNEAAFSITKFFNGAFFVGIKYRFSISGVEFNALREMKEKGSCD